MSTFTLDSTGDRAMRAVFGRPTTARLWGTDFAVTPRVVPGQLGDGRKLIALQPANTRPDYYVVRLDGGTDMNDPAEWLDDAYDLIADAFGDDGDAPFPALSSSSGSSWDEIDAEDVDAAFRGRWRRHDVLMWFRSPAAKGAATP